MSEIVLNFAEVRRLLLRRGTSLNDGIAGDVATAIAQATGLKADPLIIEMFKSFDGFPVGVVDGGSGIRIWPLRDVLSVGSQKSSSSRIDFADFLMNSNNLSFDIADEQQPILYDETDEQVAEGVSDFLYRLAHGKLDFL
jgi:hypothetical protein